MEIAGWASAQARLGNLQASEDAIRDALQREPGNVDFLLRLAEVRRLRDNTSGYVDVVLEALKKAPDREDVLKAGTRAQLKALYLPRPEGYQKSLTLAEQLENTSKRTDPMLFVRKAAALGQKYAYLKTIAGEQGAALSKSEAKAAIEQVIRLSPEYESDPRNVLRQLYDPTREGSNPSENDLEIFKLEEDSSTEKEFRSLIYRA
jgi:hypothetical protein